MDVRELVETWQAEASDPLTMREYAIRLTVQDAARLAALGDVFPARGETGLLRDLIAAALDVVERELPSATGPIVSETDEGDPVYESSGPAVLYRERLEHHLSELSAEAARQLAP